MRFDWLRDALVYAPVRFGALLLAFGSLIVHLPSVAAPKCTELGYNNFPQSKRNKLYLYFPLQADSTFPEFGIPGSFSTTPASKFDVLQLTSYLGAGPMLRDAIVDVVTDTYCEFNVEVIATDTAPPSTFPRRNVIAIGTDSMSDDDGAAQWGQAQGPDANDRTAVDFARVWAGTYQSGAGRPGGALQGVNSTIERWARSIGGTVAHEAGHNYGLKHSDGYVLGPNEDELKHHVMADGDMYDDEARAGYRRHFSDHEYSVLASNVGLAMQTVFTWTLTNPNMETATGFAIDFLSPRSDLTLASSYTGPLSPWAAPALSKPAPPTGVYQGDTYFHYRLTWSVAKTWDGGSPGEVSGGSEFHVGTGFNAGDPGVADPIIVFHAELTSNARGGPLALQPRIPAFDAGMVNPSSGVFEVAVSSNEPALLVIDSATVQMLPRLASIDSMRLGATQLLDVFGLPIGVWQSKRIPVDDVRRLVKGKPQRLSIARLRDGRRVVSIVSEADCRARDTRGKRPDTTNCKPGINVGLFPATASLLTVTAVDPKAKQWSPRERAYVVAPLKTTIHYQLGGIHPDLNRNGVDDYIDIATGQAKDRGDWLIYPLPKPRR